MGDKLPRTIAYDGNGDCQYIYKIFAGIDYEYTEIDCVPAKKSRHITEAEETDYFLMEEDEYEHF